MYSRREVFTALAAGSVAVGNLFGQQSAATAEGSKPFTLPSLPYPADALEPHIDAQTMQIHHGKHHAAYVNNLNNALAAHPDLAKKPVDEILKNLNAVPEAVRTVVRNNGGGHSNHSLFWKMLSKQGGKPSGELAKAIDKKFGSLQSFQDQFTKAAVGQFGSGWAWLAMNSQKELQIVGTPNQDTPVMTGSTPLLGLDVWEHAYYLKYQNRRPEYVAAFWNVVNWNFVNERFQQL